MSRDRRVGFVLVGLLLLFGARGAWAEPPTDQLKAHIDQVVKILEDPALKGESKVTERRAAVRTVANDLFDFAEMAKRTLARHWQGQTAQEREEFARLYADVLERAYISKIELYGGGAKIRYGREQLDGNFATVTTKITTRQGLDVPVDYRMLRQGDRWLVYDVAIEGISLVSNYRSQFNQIIQTSSYEELVRRMKAKQEEFRAPAPSSAPIPGRASGLSSRSSLPGRVP